MFMEMIEKSFCENDGVVSISIKKNLSRFVPLKHLLLLYFIKYA